MSEVDSWRDVATIIAEAIAEDGWVVRITTYPRINVDEESVPLALIAPTGLQYVEEARGIIRRIREYQVTIYLGDKPFSDSSAIDEAGRKALEIYGALQNASERWLEEMPEVEAPDRVERQIIPGDVAWIRVRVSDGLVKGE